MKEKQFNDGNGIEDQRTFYKIKDFIHTEGLIEDFLVVDQN